MFVSLNVGPTGEIFMKHHSKRLAIALVAGLLATTPANAALTLFQQFNGNVGLSTDGGGSVANSYGIRAFVPFGATVVAAYLYQTNVQNAGVQSFSLNGNALAPTALPTGSGFSSARADVTSFVAAIINGGAGGIYNFTVGEGNTNSTDGTALAVVYSLASLPVQTVALLDGFAATTGDMTTLNLAAPTAAGFTAELRLGIGYSAGGQSSTVNVNGTTITNNAGNFDDGIGANGALITVGGNDDPFSTLLPTYANDHERYNIAPYVALGSSQIIVRTNNPTNDDNIFLAAFVVSGNAGVNAPPPESGVPEPASWAMMMVGFGGVGYSLRRRQNVNPRVRLA